MKSRSLIQVGLGCWLCTATPSPAAEPIDAPVNFRIKSITMAGNGCDPNHSTLAISSDHQAFTAIFDDFALELPAANSPGQLKKNCRLMFDTEQDLGWEFAIIAVTARGYAALDAGVVGHQILNYGVGGGAERQRSAMVLRGPLNDDYVNAADVASSELVFSGCHAMQNFNRTKDFIVGTVITLKAQRAGAAGLLTVDSLDGKWQMDFDLIWRRCARTNERNVAICQVNASDGSSRSILAKGVGKDPSTALNKARANIAQRCAKAAARGMQACKAAQAVCKQLTF